MSDPMEDLDLLVSIRDAMLAHLNDCAAVDCAAEASVRAIIAAGYRIVKPDTSHSVEYALYYDEDGEGDDICQVAGSYGPPDMAAAEILNAAQNYPPEEIEIEEIIRVPVTTDELWKLIEQGN